MFPSAFRAIVAVAVAVAIVGRCLSKLVAENETGVICPTESYDARCQEGHVILMTTAKYGRMTMNRCIDRNYGYLGCGSDVTRKTDALCSGRRECSVAIPSAFLESATLECPRDLKSHLEASHTCVPVVTPKSLGLSSDFCTGKSEVSPIQVHLDRGHLSSHVMIKNRLGSAACPYVLETEKGRSFTFILWQFSIPHKIYQHQQLHEIQHQQQQLQHLDDGDFSHSINNNNNNNNNNSLNNHDKSCLVLLKIREDRRSQHVCSSGDRKKVVLVSRSNVVEVAFNSLLPDEVNFLLEFKVNKCSHPPGNLPHEYFSFQRSSGDVEQVKITCAMESSGSSPSSSSGGGGGGGGSWMVRCHEDRWVGSMPGIKDCKDRADRWVAGIEGVEDGDIRHMRMTLVAICFIAVLFALCILVAGLIIFKCVKRRAREPIQGHETQRAPPSNAAFNYPQVCCPQKDNQVENFSFYHLPPPYLHQDPYKFQENTYSSISEIAAQMPFKATTASPTLSLRLQTDSDKRHQQHQQQQQQRQTFNSDFVKLQTPYSSSMTNPPATFQRIQQQLQQQQQQQQLDSLCYSPRDAVKTSTE